MRTFIIILAVVLLLCGALAAWLVVTTPRSRELVRFPLAPAHQELLGRVPADAEAFALIPSAAVLHASVTGNPVTRDAVLQWVEEHEMPRPWMLGGADVVVWKTAGRTSYAVRLDRVRALLIRFWLMGMSNADARWEGTTLFMHDVSSAPRLGDTDEILALASQLPAGDVFVVQQQSSRGAFPPMARPAVTSIRITQAEITLVSRAPGSAGESNQALHPQFARGAMLSAVFAEAPRVMTDLNRLVGGRIDALVADGGGIVIYDVDTGTLLPRPRGLVVVPATPEAKAHMEDIRQVAEIVGGVAESGGSILVSFDRNSAARYLENGTAPGRWPAGSWAVSINPRTLLPVLRKAGDNQGLRLVAPRIHRAARDLRRWIDALEHSGAIEAADSVSGGVEELRVRVESK